MSGPTVTLFWAPGCPHCDAARDYLARTHHDVVCRDVSADDQAMADLLMLTGATAVPALSVGDLVTAGFDPVRLEEMVEEASAPPPAPGTDPDPRLADGPPGDEP